MKVFHINNDKLNVLNEKKINLEKDIQSLIEKNLKVIYNIEFIASEFTIKNRRIDTLAYDPETNSFIIIEYKRDRSKSVVDQGYAYLYLLSEYKADFVLLFNKVKKDNRGINDFDWSQSRIIFIAKTFMDYSKEATSFRDVPFELWEASIFDKGILVLEKVKRIKSSTSINVFTAKNKVQNKIEREIKVYDIDYHLSNKPNFIKDIFEQLREEILNIDENIEEKPVKTYIGYKLRGFIITALFFSKSRISFYLFKHKKDYDDPKNILKDVPEGMCGFSINSIEDVPYAIHLIKQSYKHVVKHLKNKGR